MSNKKAINSDLTFEKVSEYIPYYSTSGVLTDPKKKESVL
jgi:hypothetical protein